jgi:hypothetical protein
MDKKRIIISSVHTITGQKHFLIPSRSLLMAVVIRISNSTGQAPLMRSHGKTVQQVSGAASRLLFLSLVILAGIDF